MTTTSGTSLVAPVSHVWRDLPGAQPLTSANTPL